MPVRHGSLSLEKEHELNSADAASELTFRVFIMTFPNGSVSENISYTVHPSVPDVSGVFEKDSVDHRTSVLKETAEM